MGFEITCTSCGGSGETLEEISTGYGETWELRSCSVCRGSGYTRQFTDPNEPDTAQHSFKISPNTSNHTSDNRRHNNDRDPLALAIKAAEKAIKDHFKKKTRIKR